MRSGFFPFFLAALFLLLCRPAGAQMSSDPGGPATFGTHLVFGQVRLAGSNAPVDHVQITLRKFSGEIVSMRPTNSNGDFTIPGVRTGYYVVLAEKDGFEPVQEEVEVALVGSTMVNLVMRPRGGASVAAASTVSARLLTIPQKAKDAYAKGVAELYDNKNPEASLPHFRLALKEAPEFYEAAFQTGVAYRTLGQNEQAETAFRKTLELSKGQFLGTRFRLASVLVDLKKYSEAESMAREGLVGRPNSWLGNFELGRALVGLGHPAEAEKSIRRALELNPGLAKGYLLLANIHLARKDAANVVKDLDDYLLLDPKGPQSDQARRVREQMQQQINQAKKASPASPSPPQ